MEKESNIWNDIIVAEEDTYQILMLETTIAVMNEATNRVITQVLMLLL